MTRNYVVVCNHWEPYGRRLYYDFNEKAFYKDRSDRKKIMNIPKAAISAVVGSRIIANFGNHFDRVFATGSWGILLISVVASIFLAIMAAYLWYRIFITDPLLCGKATKIRVFSDELDDLLKKARRRALQTVCAIGGSLAYFVFSIIVFFDDPLFFILSWGVIGHALLVCMPHRQIKFRKLLKRGEIWIDRIYSNNPCSDYGGD